MQELWNWGKGANPIPRPLDTDFDFDNDRTDCLETTPEGACVYGRAVAILSSLTVIILVLRICSNSLTGPSRPRMRGIETVVAW